MAKPKKLDLKNPAPVADDEDEETLAAIGEGMRDAEAGRTVPAEGSPSAAGRGSPGRSPGQIGTLHQKRGHESVAVVMGNRSRVAGSEVRLRVV